MTPTLASTALLAALFQPEPFAALELESTITHLEVAPRAGLVAVAEECGSLRLLDARTLKERRRIDLDGAPLDLAISYDGNWVAVQAASGTVTVWNPAAEQPIRSIPHDAGGALAFFARTTELVLVDAAGTVRRVDAASGRLGVPHTFEDARGIEAVEISRDGRVVAYALDDG